jgi:hypothetical protein
LKKILSSAALASAIFNKEIEQKEDEAFVFFSRWRQNCSSCQKNGHCVCFQWVVCGFSQRLNSITEASLF